MKLVINVPDYVKEQADDGKGEELGIPLWLVYEIANGTPHETVTEFADRCRECGREKVLDKIRAEVEAIERYGTNNGKDLWLRIPEEIKKDVLTIIDKYKVESEKVKE